MTIGPVETICPLTVSELRTLESVGKGGYRAAAAKRLGCSEQHVKNTLTVVTRKLGVTTTLQAVVYAVERGWISNLTLDRETKWLLYRGGVQGSAEPRPTAPGGGASPSASR